MKVIYEEEGIFASHPANHGNWQNNKECLFGILTGKRGNGLYHKIEEPYKKVLLRSKDLCKNWVKEIPNVDFNCTYISDDEPKIINFKDKIIRACGSYDTGGEDCISSGGFYLSSDFGNSWSNPMAFKGLEDILNPPYLCTTRTAKLPNENIVFISARKMNSWGSDFVACTEYNEKEGRFKLLSIIPHESGRCVMPAAVRLHDDCVLVATRRIQDGKNFIEVFLSKDNFLKWISVAKFSTGSNNGNPPAVIIIDQVIYITYANRQSHNLMLQISKDGYSFEEKIWERNIGKDIGYPVLFGDSSSGPIAIIYSDGQIKQTYI